MARKLNTNSIDFDAGWQRLMSLSCRDISELQRSLGIPDEELEKLETVQDTFPLLANPYYLSLIDPDDPDDPIRRMCLPSEEELDAAGMADTSGEALSTVLPGLQHKYSETALALSNAHCAINCRHCFRRRFVGTSYEEVVQSIDEVAAYVAEHPEITNVLVTGGDAFMNGNEVIRKYLELLTPIDHLRFIRFGTRTPVALPQRITSDPELVEMLVEFGKRKQLFVVTQFNHPAEITPESTAAVRALLHADVPVRNQTVLLRGVNDSSETLVQLMNGLAEIGVIPYYVFQCRPVIGVKNRFQVPLQEGLRIVEQAQANLNGPAKCFRFMMSHKTGKIEILGQLEGSDTMLFKYHQARDRSDLGKLFELTLPPDTCWLDL